MDYENMTFEQKFNYLVDKYPQARGTWLRRHLYNLNSTNDGLASMPGAPPEDREAWGYWILDSPKIMEIMTSGKTYNKILAIKEVRAATSMGLKESKDAVEYAELLIAQGAIGRTEAEQLDKEVKEVIASLTGSENHE